MTSFDSLAGRRLYLDTNVFVYALNAFPPFVAVLSRLLTAADAGEVAAVTSELTGAGLLVKPLQDGDAAAEATTRALIFQNARLTTVPVSRDVLIEAARVRASAAGLKLPDAIHLATAALSGCDLFLTNDVRLRAAGSSVPVLLLSDLTP